jgi:hypothetical protein
LIFQKKDVQLELSKLSVAALFVLLIATLMFRDACTLGAFVATCLLNAYLVHGERITSRESDDSKQKLKELSDKIEALTISKGLRRG